jgi:hypothetical protein
MELHIVLMATTRRCAAHLANFNAQIKAQTIPFAYHKHFYVMAGIIVLMEVMKRQIFAPLL